MQLQIFSFSLYQIKGDSTPPDRSHLSAGNNATLLIWEMEHSAAHMRMYMMAINEIDF